MTTSWLRPLPVRAIREDEEARLDRRSWPATLPAVRSLLDEGLEPGSLTVLVGENGSGKSTIIEGIALAYGLSTGGRLDRRPAHHPRLGVRPAHRAAADPGRWGEPMGLLPAGRDQPWAVHLPRGEPGAAQ